MLLLTGAQGYIGHDLNFGAPVYRADFSPGANFKGCFSEVPEEVLSKVTTVVHLADIRLGDYTQETMTLMRQRTNIFIQRLAAKSKLNNLVLSSSCSVYGHSDNEINEHSPVNPTTFYAESKLITENMFLESGLPLTRLRFGTAYGLNQKSRFDLFLNQLIFSIKNQEPITIFGAQAWRPYIHFSDFRRALVHAVNLPPNQLFNVAESNHTKEMILNYVREFSSQIIYVDKKDLRNYKVNCDRIKATGFRFNHKLEDYFKLVLSPRPNVLFGQL